MKKKMVLKTFRVLVFVAIVSGCYESKVPIASSENSSIDLQLLGSWKSEHPETQTSEKLLFLKFNDHEYFAEYLEHDEDDVERFRAYKVMVDDIPFLNAQNIGEQEDDEKSYSFFRYSFSEDGELILKMVSSDFVKTEFNTSQELFGFIKTHVNDEKLYEKPVKFSPD